MGPVPDTVGALHAEGDKAFVEFLSDEGEKKIEMQSLSLTCLEIGS